MRLRACDISECVIDDKPALSINFRTSKTDPSFKGSISYIVKIDGECDLCTYSIFKGYYEAYGFKFGGSDTTDLSFLFCRSQSIGYGLHRCVF